MRNHGAGRRFIAAVFRATLGAALLALVAQPARAATLCVNPGGTAGCFASVQAAVDAAASRDVVEIAAGTYVENVVLPNKRLTLHGAGPTATVIDGNGSGAVVSLPFLGTNPVSIENLGVRNGTVGVEIDQYFRSKLFLTDCAVSDNAGSGVIEGNRATITITRCVISGNGGIGVSAGKKLTIEQSTIAGNTGGGVIGGKLHLIESTVADNAGGGVFGNRFKVERSTISGNTASLDGGGFRIDNGQGRSTISNSTISGNSAGRHGGGIFVQHHRLVLDHVTIAGNSAVGKGGGLYASVACLPPHTCTPADFLLKPVALRASLLADNGASSAADCLADRALASGGNLIEDPDQCTIAGNSPVVSADPALGPLQDNGGPTETRQLLAGSPALDAVTGGVFCRAADQRGVARSAPCDIGAYEVP